MPLPTIETPTYELKLPSSNKKIKYRPFLVKEEKILIIALESRNQSEITNAVTDVLKKCILTKGVDVDDLPTFDIEYVFLNIRAKSIGEDIKLTVTCPDDNETKVPVTIYVDEIKVQKQRGHKTDIVLDVSKKVTALLEEKGVKVKMTRSSEVDLDLSPRVSFANRTDADIFVSIHANASRGKKRSINGLETFYYDGWKGRLLAQKIQQEILKVSPGSPDRGVRRGSYYVIRKTNMPAVLVEIGFVTGKLDARRLEKSSHRNRVAYAIAKGILEYLRRIG